MENPEDTMPDEMPPQLGEASEPEDTSPASPEETGAPPPPEAAHAGQAGSAESGEPDQGDLPASDQEVMDDQHADLEAPVPPTPSGGKSGRRWLLTTLLGLLILALIAAISAFGGYRSGITLRQEAEGTQMTSAIRQQYELGVQDLEEGNYYRARQRFEYIIGLDPLYPGAEEKLAEALYGLNTTATPTLVPTPTLTPTPDMRSTQELFDQGQEYLRKGEWDNAIETLLALRKASPDFNVVQVDGMLFIALRNRGKDKILLHQDLEGGIYDLTLAQRFGLLDTEADGLLNWTQLYITGASFWEIDWGQAAYYFGQVAPHLPNLMDKSGYTAGERYRLALKGYAYQLADQKKYCQAYEQLQISLSLAYDPQVEQDMNTAAELCAQQQKSE
jgi:hypothetical protein